MGSLLASASSALPSAWVGLLLRGFSGWLCRARCLLVALPCACFALLCFCVPLRFFALLLLFVVGVCVCVCLGGYTRITSRLRRTDINHGISHHILDNSLEVALPAADLLRSVYVPSCQTLAARDTNSGGGFSADSILDSLIH